MRVRTAFEHRKKDVTAMTITTNSAVGRNRAAQPEDRSEQICDDARLLVSAHSADATDCRDLTLMLGLVEVDPSGTLTKANPWDAG
ncbi:MULTISPECIES: hypothetical protein [Paenarthrobacter]|uniref:Transposase n=2 Tax=Paenarthrobacter TaxID=1742992 RepID=A0AAX3ED43_PAEUR|nr:MULTISPECIES: hypothetical protein [Paenarthrobacter]MDO5865129.1 hypothetical protein [Paenarthrobacter sp. SD-2]QMU82943.1 hypothetical protein FV140_13130 [Paenarthrobacter ureafaciens]UYV91477.1 hypothetical protein NL395_13045 [Paenarthrobacter ureafaciens]UYV95997.1 hypothetical protein NL394_12990 [Paenarthrobacter ureafaciens]WIV31371.1 hypothetical protein QN084_01730 [Paenarthrobacter sp. R1]